MTTRLVLLRHGQSASNHAGRFTGWTDADLTVRGIEEARRAGRALRESGFAFDVAYTSLLKRAIRTLWLVLDEMDRIWIPVHRSWRLNERHYGALEGKNKRETAQEYGAERVLEWRKRYDARPPPADETAWANLCADPRYRDLADHVLPRSESLKDTVTRFAPYWSSEIVPRVRAGQSVIVVAHCNTLRAVAQCLDKVPENEVARLDVPTGVPLVYELESNLNPKHRCYLGGIDDSPEVVPLTAGR